MITAYLSPQAKLLLRADGEGWSALTYAKVHSGWQPAPPDMLWSLQNCDDFAKVTATTDDELKNILIDAVDESEAVDLTLMLLDGRLSDNTRLLAAEELEEVVRYPEIRERLEFLFAAQPLPGDATLDSACRVAQATCPATVDFLAWIDRHQPGIITAHRAWTEFWSAPPAGTSPRKSVEAVFLQFGVFRDVAIAMESHSAKALVLVKWLLHRELRQRCEQAPQIMQAWLNVPIDSRSGLPKGIIRELKRPRAKSPISSGPRVLEVRGAMKEKSGTHIPHTISESQGRIRVTVQGTMPVRKRRRVLKGLTRIPVSDLRLETLLQMRCGLGNSGTKSVEETATALGMPQESVQRIELDILNRLPNGATGIHIKPRTRKVRRSDKRPRGKYHSQVRSCHYSVRTSTR